MFRGLMGTIHFDVEQEVVLGALQENNPLMVKRTCWTALALVNRCALFEDSGQL